MSDNSQPVDPLDEILSLYQAVRASAAASPTSDKLTLTMSESFAPVTLREGLELVTAGV